MAERASPWGAASMFLGVLALVLAVAVFQLERFPMIEAHPQAWALGWLDRLGLVAAPDLRAGVWMAPAYATSIDDPNLLEWAHAYAAWLSLCAMGTGWLAERRRESTRHLAIGCICAGLAWLFLGSLAAALLAWTACALAITLLRRWPTATRGAHRRR